MAFGGLTNFLHYLHTGHRYRPGIPLELDGLLDSVLKLQGRSEQMKPAMSRFEREYTIQGRRLKAITFLFGTSPNRMDHSLRQLVEALEDANILKLVGMFTGDLFQWVPENLSATRLSLDSPEQFDISITEFDNAYEEAKPLYAGWAASLVDPEVATRSFWPNLAEHGLAYNLLFLKKIRAAELGQLQAVFGEEWQASWSEKATQGKLFAIDLNLFSQFPSASVDGLLRFTPGTITLLEQGPDKSLQPFAIRVTDYQQQHHRVFERGAVGPRSWLYALQAAKVSVTVYGIWLGHVYHWHIVTAAMLKAMQRNLSEGHPVRALLGPQSDFLIQFDEILLLAWRFIAPPTSFDTPDAFLNLIDAFARGRSFFDDDPSVELDQHGILKGDFSDQRPWDRYPIVPYYLDLYQASGKYVQAVVEASYASDGEVADDQELQAWLAEAAEPGAGNLNGLGDGVQTRQALQNILTSLMYRLTMHGCSRLHKSLSPVLMSAANYPVCLQREDIPQDDNFRLLDYLPKTGTIGLMIRFYSIFIYSAPYVPLLPEGGVETELYFAADPGDPRNRALVEFRRSVLGLMQRWQPERDQGQQWPRNIET